MVHVSVQNAQAAPPPPPHTHTHTHTHPSGKHAPTQQPPAHTPCQRFQPRPNLHRTDDGYWSTNGKFSFRKSLIQAQFRAYERTNSVYKDNMKSLYKEIKQVNYELESTPMDRAIVTLATMRRDVGGDKSLLLLPDVAPPRIMDTPVKEIKLFKGDDDTDSPTKEPTASGTSSPTVAPIPTSSPTSAPTGECGEVGIYGNLCDLTVS